MTNQIGVDADKNNALHAWLEESTDKIQKSIAATMAIVDSEFKRRDELIDELQRESAVRLGLIRVLEDERDENESVFKVWRRRCEEAENKIDSLQNTVDHAHRVLRSTLYAGGPSEQDACLDAMEALGAVVTDGKNGDNRNGSNNHGK